MKATILKIIRLGFQGDKKSLKGYVEMLADEFETYDKKFADRLRKYSLEDFGKVIKPMENEIPESKWIQFECDSLTKSKITKRWTIVSKDGNFVLGVVKWFARWRGYAFFPHPDTVFETQCLSDITSFIQYQNKTHRENRKMLKETKETTICKAEI